MIVQPRSIDDRPALSQQLGKYQLVATLGQGGMGTVYLALASGFAEFRKLLVVKELRQDLTRQKGFVSMFMDEARLAARLAHPNVVHTFEASVVADRYFIAMEYLDGQSLSALLDRLSKSPSSKLSLWMQLQILCEALSGLHYAHTLADYDGSLLQVVHRDVSPQNVFVTYHGQVKVVDFGVAKVANAGVKTAPGVFMGKFSYAAPEQVMGEPVDARTDVFAVGVMLWQAIAGRPFSEQAPSSAACRARCEGLEPRIAEVVPTVDPVLARICDRALAVDPDERFSSAAEFRSELHDYMQEAGVRVEASEIGELMCDVFDTERRALHSHIEQAMRHTGASDSSVDELSIFHFADKEPTAVADLSSLVDVSLERDDQKIRQGYAHSKITLLRTPTEQEPVMVTRASSHPPRRRLLAIAGLSLAGLVGGMAAVLAYLSATEAAMETRAQSAAHPPEAPVAPKLELDPPPAGNEEPVLAATPQVAATAPDVSSSVLQPTRSRSSPPSAASTSSSRSRTRSTPAPARPSAPAHDLPEPVHLALPEPAGNSRPVEEGTELLFRQRPAGVRIDRENPYR